MFLACPLVWMVKWICKKSSSAQSSVMTLYTSIEQGWANYGPRAARQSILCGPWARRRSSHQLLVCWSSMDLCLNFWSIIFALYSQTSVIIWFHIHLWTSFFLSENKQVEEQVDANWLQFECSHANHNQWTCSTVQEHYTKLWTVTFVSLFVIALCGQSVCKFSCQTHSYYHYIFYTL